ncbi:hypothetical protein GCK72_021318 [Caenorhabditis remanei]|uniref:Uncharacterized protein n=2 Tax=Caenorhabditis remanei TaxID=31234 RepID=A0A6A5GIY1_CAERE|nr:hypothetical protein GCK72_021318 [Caenorhabditis remanei]KAF1754754.1 hypothetical protein GCK72_021318 [Caenorhabditis remanei]
MKLDPEEEEEFSIRLKDASIKEEQELEIEEVEIRTEVWYNQNEAEIGLGPKATPCKTKFFENLNSFSAKFFSGLFKLDTFELYEAYPKLAAVNLNSDDLYKADTMNLLSTELIEVSWSAIREVDDPKKKELEEAEMSVAELEEKNKMLSRHNGFLIVFEFKNGEEFEVKNLLILGTDHWTEIVTGQLMPSGIGLIETKDGFATMGSITSKDNS